jgi:hypothetical protein
MDVDFEKNRGRELANIDLPFHDFHHVDETTATNSYTVGHNNLGQGKDQKKLFVSKCTLIYCTEDTHIHFNNAMNVAVTSLANTWYTFYCNIYAVYTTAITQGKDLYLYFEGVLSKDCGIAEA